MDTIIKTITGALEKIPEDIRDYSHDTVFGTLTPNQIPLVDFDISDTPPVFLDQKDLDFCTAFSSSEENTVEEGAENDYFDPLYQMAKIKQIRGEFTAPGANLRDAASALVTYGSLPKSKSPFTYDTGAPTDQTRDFLANWANWPPALDTLAAQYKAGSFFAVDGPNDPFWNIISTLYMNKQKGIKEGVLIGVQWRPEWTAAPGGVITDNYSASAGEGHALYIRGMKVINGVPYAKVQNSWNKQYGDGGIYYFPANAIDIEVSAGFGLFTLKPLPQAVAAYYNENKRNFFTKLISIL